MEKLKQQLDSITVKYKNKFSASLDKKDAIELMMQRLDLIGKLQSQLADELIKVSNKYFNENNIDDTTEIEEYIKKQIKSFVESAKPWFSPLLIGLF